MDAVFGRLVRPVRRSLCAAVRAASNPGSLLPDRGRHPTDRPTVGVAGFYGWGNYGDELFWLTFQEHLGPAMELRNLLGPGAGSRGLALRRAVRDTDAVLIGAGDLVIPWRRSRYWSATLLERPAFIAGVGVPSWGHEGDAGLAQLRHFFRDPAVRLVAARDRESADWIDARLGPDQAVAVTPDLACGLTLPSVEPPAGPPILGVNVRRRSTGGDDLTRVRELCERAAARGFRVRRIVLGTGNTRKGDLEAARGLGLEDTELIATDDLDAISRAIAECQVFATMKFHGVVAAVMSGVAPIALMPTSKTKRFLTELGRPELLSSYADPGLPALAERDLQPIAVDIRDRLRRDAVAFLGTLRAAILAQAAEGWRSSGR